MTNALLYAVLLLIVIATILAIVYIIFAGIVSAITHKNILFSWPAYIPTVVVVIGSIAGLFAFTGKWGPAEYSFPLHRNSFNTQFVVEIRNESDKTYYEKADCTYKQNTLFLNRVNFNNGGYLTADDCDELSYDNFASFHDQDGNMWDIRLIKEIPENGRSK